jgi:hypothetical protein
VKKDLDQVEDNTLDKTLLTRLRDLDKHLSDGELTDEQYLAQTTILHNALLELAKAKNETKEETTKTVIGFRG